jgi:hypothetical protein
MSFQVEWLETALDELTSLWLQADAVQRRAITQATHAIELKLGSDPLNEGESRPGDRRITFVPPLAVRFRVESDASETGTFRVPGGGKTPLNVPVSRDGVLAEAWRLAPVFSNIQTCATNKGGRCVIAVQTSEKRRVIQKAHAPAIRGIADSWLPHPPKFGTCAINCWTKCPERRPNARTSHRFSWR